MTTLIALVATIVALALVVLAFTVWLEHASAQADHAIHEALHGPLDLYGPLTLRDPDESVAAACGWDDPFINTRRQIAALKTLGENA